MSDSAPSTTDGSALIFVASQPRSGSTLLQRILVGHPEISTAEEPWLMLPPVYSLRSEGVEAEYSTYWAAQAIDRFLAAFKDGRDVYYDGLRRMYGSIYEQYLDEHGGSYFLDKTPRYYLILPELHRVFPKATFVLLVRNPLAVLSSILRTWIGPNWFKLAAYGIDLRKGPEKLIQGKDALGDRAALVQYEDLVENPGPEVEAICRQIGVPFDPALLTYENRNFNWKYGDQTKVRDRDRPDTGSIKKWVRAVQDDPQHWRLLRDYLDGLSPALLRRMGYSHDHLSRSLDRHEPSRSALRFTHSLDWLLAKPKEKRDWVDINLQRLKSSLLRNGLSGTVGRALSRTASEAKRLLS